MMADLHLITKEELIEKFKEIESKGWIENYRKGNDGAVGNILEDLLGIPENNLPIPNAAEWELKAQRSNTTSLITLCHVEPSPRVLSLVSNVLFPNMDGLINKQGKSILLRRNHLEVQQMQLHSQIEVLS